MAQIAGFLARIGFLEIKSDQLHPLIRGLEISPESQQLERFLSNWRFAAIEKLNGPETGHYFYSEPMTLGKGAYARLRKRLEEAVADCKKIARSERSEDAVCLNIDLFRIGGQPK